MSPTSDTVDPMDLKVSSPVISLILISEKGGKAYEITPRSQSHAIDHKFDPYITTEAGGDGNQQDWIGVVTLKFDFHHGGLK